MVSRAREPVLVQALGDGVARRARADDDDVRSTPPSWSSPVYTARGR